MIQGIYNTRDSTYDARQHLFNTVSFLLEATVFPKSKFQDLLTLNGLHHHLTLSPPHFLPYLKGTLQNVLHSMKARCEECESTTALVT